jgi:hypothetical protein
MFDEPDDDDFMDEFEQYAKAAFVALVAAVLNAYARSCSC